jgi:hypothetical protein
MSPTSLKLYESDPVEYYLKHMAVHRAPRIPQTRAMSIGSAFDAMVKDELHKRIFGSPYPGDLFETQVEACNRDWARVHGPRVYAMYVSCGLFADLLGELAGAVSVRMETEIRFTLDSDPSGSGVSTPLMGKPDLFAWLGSGAPYCLDWKINGYCSRAAVSPPAGYVMSRDSTPSLGSRSHGRAHPSVQAMVCDGVLLDVAGSLGQDDATQIMTYALGMGCPVGDTKLIAAIDRMTGVGGGDGSGATTTPAMRGSRYRFRIKDAQWSAMRTRYATAWTRITARDFLPLEQMQLLDHMYDPSRSGDDAFCMSMDR